MEIYTDFTTPPGGDSSIEYPKGHLIVVTPALNNPPEDRGRAPLHAREDEDEGRRARRQGVLLQDAGGQEQQQLGCIRNSTNLSRKM